MITRDDVEGRLLKELPLREDEDGILVIVDRVKGVIRVFYEGSEITLAMIEMIMNTAKDMFKQQIDDQDEEEKKEEKDLN